MEQNLIMQEKNKFGTNVRHSENRSNRNHTTQPLKRMGIRTGEANEK